MQMLSRKPPRHSFVHLRKAAGAFISPNGILFHSYNPQGSQVVELQHFKPCSGFTHTNVDFLHTNKVGLLWDLNSPLEIMFKFPCLALTRLSSHSIAQSRGEIRSQSRP